MDSLYSIVQMPAGVPVGTLAIGKPGAIKRRSLRERAGAERQGGCRKDWPFGASRTEA